MCLIINRDALIAVLASVSVQMPLILETFGSGNNLKNKMHTWQLTTLYQYLNQI